MTNKDLLEALQQDVLKAAPCMLGFDLVMGDIRARIAEVEAYMSPGDPGSHAARGETPRNRVMFGPAGKCYVYFTYGNHWMLNVTAHPPGRAGAVLIRAARPLSGLEVMRARRPKARRDQDLLNGPGKLCQALGIDAALYGVDIFEGDSPLRLEPGESVSVVLVDTRIGLAPGKGDELPWRFLDGDQLEWVSVKPKSQFR